MEDYKKKYEEALERTRTFILRWQGIGAVNSELALKELKEIFSELKDNKDEAIKNDIIITLSNDVMCDDSALYPGANTTLKEAVAWLKKQGEPLCWIKCSDGLPNRDGTYLVVTDGRHNDVYDMARYDSIEGWHKASEIIYWMPIPQLNNKSIIEQKPADEVKPKFKVGDKIKLAKEPKYPAREIIAIKNDAYCFDKLEQLPFIHQDKWELVEQKPAWSEEDERMCKNLLFLMEQENSISSWEGCYEWLESLKERYTWKPSDEQMRELGIVATGMGWFNKDVLSGLLEQLKKLREIV